MYGHHVHEAVLAAGEKESGITIHFMDEGIDTGDIIVQKKCSIDGEETVESVQKKVQELEKEWYPKVLEELGLLASSNLPIFSKPTANS
jgi:phosphoribosylglycinamide formyltransferase-1